MEPGFLNKKRVKAPDPEQSSAPERTMSGVSTGSRRDNSESQESETTAAHIDVPRRLTSKAIAFGRNYFHCVGGTTATLRKETKSSPTTVQYEWDNPTWSKAAREAAGNAKDSTPTSPVRPRHKLISLRSGRQQQQEQQPQQLQNAPSSKDKAKFQQEQSSSSEDDDAAFIVQVVATSQSTVFLTKSGAVYQTGTLHGRVYTHPTHITIPLPIPCVELAAGRHFCLGRMQGGIAVCSWGAGHFGQLGIHSDDHQPITFSARPILMERLLPGAVGSVIVQVAAGDWHGMALTESGMVFAWGSNRSQQCGRRQKSSASSDETPTLVVPAPVPLEIEIGQITAGRSHSLALTKVTKQVYSWGSSIHGQCGNAVRRSPQAPRIIEGMRDLNIAKIAAGGNHSLALTMGGRLFSWGQQTEGQLGLGGAYLAQPKPKLVTELDFVAIVAGQEWKSQQRSAGVGSGDKSTTSDSFESPLKNIPRIVDMYAGPSYSVALSSSGHTYCFGSNDAGQLGVASPAQLPLIDNTFPTAAMAKSGKTSSSNNNSMLKTPPRKSNSINKNNVENGNCDEDVHVQTFDSRHNVLLPTRLDHVVDTMFVRTVGCGPNHLWLIGDELTEEEAIDPATHPVGYTLHEVQSGFVRPPYQAREKVEVLEPSTNAAAEPIMTPEGNRNKGLRIVSTQTGGREDVTEEADESFSSAPDFSVIKQEEQRTPTRDGSQPSTPGSGERPRSRFGIQRLSHKIRKRLGGGNSGSAK